MAGPVVHGCLDSSYPVFNFNAVVTVYLDLKKSENMPCQLSLRFEKARRNHQVRSSNGRFIFVQCAGCTHHSEHCIRGWKPSFWSCRKCCWQLILDTNDLQLMFPIFCSCSHRLVCLHVTCDCGVEGQPQNESCVEHLGSNIWELQLKFCAHNRMTKHPKGAPFWSFLSALDGKQCLLRPSMDETRIWGPSLFNRPFVSSCPWHVTSGVTTREAFATHGTDQPVFFLSFHVQFHSKMTQTFSVPHSAWTVLLL